MQYDGYENEVPVAGRLTIDSEELTAKLIFRYSENKFVNGLDHMEGLIGWVYQHNQGGRITPKVVLSFQPVGGGEIVVMSEAFLKYFNFGDLLHDNDNFDVEIGFGFG